MRTLLLHWALMKVAILGAGSYGTALAYVAGHTAHVALWARSQEVVDDINNNHVNSHYADTVSLGEHVTASTDVATVVADADIVVFAVPSVAYVSVADLVRAHIAPDAILVSAAKGFSPEHDTLTPLSALLESAYPHHTVLALSGPSFSAEIMKDTLTGVLLAGGSHDERHRVSRVFTTASFRVYHYHDRTSIEFAGALKNVYAIVLGFVTARHMGANARALIISRSLAEMERVITQHGADGGVVRTLAGVGDFMLSELPPFSRNYAFGYVRGGGESPRKDAVATDKTLEGVRTTQVLQAYATAHDIELPIATYVAHIIDTEVPSQETLRTLLESDTMFTNAL